VTALALVFVVMATLALAILPPLHPAQIWTVVWALAVGAYSWRLLPYSPLSSLGQLLIGGSTLMFVGGTFLGGHVVARVARAQTEGSADDSERRVHIAAMLALATNAFGLCAFLLQAARSFGLRNALVSSPQVRHAVQTGAFNITIKYVYVAVAAAALCGAAAAIGPHRRRWAVGAGAAVLTTYFTTGRATVVAASAVALCAYALTRRRLPSKRTFIATGAAVAVLALGVFTLGGSLIGKTFDDSELVSIDSVFSRHAGLHALALPYEYVSAPIAAFGVETAVDGSLPKLRGCASFSYACSALRHIGLDAEPLPAVRPFTSRPLRWNTYTALDAPLLDGGPWLVLPATLVAGLALGALWGAARRRRLLGILFYAALTPAIVTSAGSNNFTAPMLLGAILTIICTLWLASALERRSLGNAVCA
jgi:oligosaccharide repeat unit polymerase